MPWQWVGQELPQFSSAPTYHAGVLSSAGIGMRLFTVAQRSGLIVATFDRDFLTLGVEALILT